MNRFDLTAIPKSETITEMWLRLSILHCLLSNTERFRWVNASQNIQYSDGLVPFDNAEETTFVLRLLEPSETVLRCQADGPNTFRSPDNWDENGVIPLNVEYLSRQLLVAFDSTERGELHRRLSLQIIVPDRILLLSIVPCMDGTESEILFRLSGNTNNVPIDESMLNVGKADNGRRTMRFNDDSPNSVEYIVLAERRWGRVQNTVAECIKTIRRAFAIDNTGGGT